MDFQNQLTSLAVLIFILSTCLSTSLAKQHPVRHAHSRHKRQYGHPSDFVPDTYVIDGPGGPEYGQWGPWSGPSECSRTCGGGVAYQTRHCYDVSPDGRPLCSGGSKRYFSCNIQNCPGDSDFRSEQCAEYNRVPFEDRYYDWVPYTKAPKVCELNCMPRGERFYYRHNRKVIDGTRCDEEKLDVCVDGQCLPVGCDMLLGSPAREDKCRECGGDGSSCNTVQGLLDNNDLQVGYNDILLIPAGATNIKVREIQPTNNYLAIRNTTGHYYLNGNWRIDFPRKLKFAGTTFHYERKPHQFYAPESVMALGPTTEPIYISLLYQETNPGVEYEYSIPKGISPHSLTDNYTWIESEFGPCSTTCGGGTQQRSVACVRRRDMVQVPENLCNANYMPTSVQACAPDPCPPAWNAGPWSQCSESCERGIQERQVYCMQIVSNGFLSVVDESECERAGEKPPNKQECNVDAICPTWHVGPWKACDKLCGDGFERRDVKCYRKVDGRIQVLDDGYCPEQKPESEKPCMLRPCEGVDWITSDWSGCDEKCGLTQETRTARCVTSSGVVFPDSFCHKYRKPELVRECETSKKCEHEWYASQWSECSSKCGDGVQTRKVFCGEIDDEGLIKKVEDDKCNAEDKYETEKPCHGEETCKGDWFAGPWSACSKECGGGEKTRKVLCVQGNETVPITNCDGSTTLFSSESCNNHPCGEDEVVTVEPTQDMSEDDEEDCEYDEDYEDDYEDEEGKTSPMESSSEASTESSEFSETSPSDISSLSTSSDMSSSEGSTESTMSTESSSAGSTESTISSSMGSSSSSSGSTESSSSGSTESSSSGSTDSSSSSGSTESSSSISTESSSSGSTESSSSSGSTESTSEGSTESTESTESSSYVSTESTESSSSVSTESTESSSSVSTESTESSSSVSTESTESSSSVSTESTESSSSVSTESTESSSSVSTESTESSSSASTESTESSSSVSTESTESSSSVSTESTESSSSVSTESTESSSSVSTESTESSSSVSTESTESTESSSSVSTESTESSSTGSTESTESTESSSTQSTESTESTESTSSVSTESTESTESSSTLSTESTESTSTQSTESTESTESTSTQSTESTESTSTQSTESTESTVSTTESSTISGSTETTLSTDSSSTTLRGIGEVDVDEDTSSSQSTESTSVGSTESTEPTESTESSSSVSTESTESTESSSSVSTESTESSSSVSTESTESSSSVSTESTESSSSVSTESTESSSSVSTESTESSSSVSTESTESSSSVSTESTESSSSVSTESTESTESSSSVSTESTESSSTGSTESTESTSTGSTESTVSTSTGSTESTEFTSSVSTESTESTESTVSGSTESTESTVSGSTESTELLSKWGTTSVEELWGPSMTSIQIAITKEQKLKKCKPKKKPKCRKSEFGCCPDNKTPAEGPFGKGCPRPETCAESEFGCCPDGVSPAKGQNEKGCPKLKCEETLFGCCPDKVSIAQGNDFEGCPEEMLPAECASTQFGCCPDNMTAATGPNFKGCFVCEGSGECESCNDTTYGCCPDNVRAATGPDFQGCEEGSGEGVDCANTTYGCCPDGIISAEGPDFKNCGVIDSENCTLSYFGCCPDGVTPALGSRYEGCTMPCASEPFGCCDDNVTPAHGPNREGCCLNSAFGCCPDNILYARGPNFDGCGCQYSPYGCCPDNQTAARGYNNEGCGCQYTPHGCCPDNYTPAPASNYQGCPCYTFQFGCCPDGVTIAKGPQRLGCGCENTEFGCCSDGKTPASGPDRAGCGCEASEFGCCPDGVEEALGEDFEGCKKQLPMIGEICKLPKDRGSCRDFTVKWFYDMEYGGCARFWYGGCDGNDNRFKTPEECKETCVAPEGKERCFLPKVEGPCEKYFPKWYYDTERKQCGQFIYGGCLGNTNNFDTREECQQLCSPEQTEDVCEQPVEEGPCEGNYPRWYFDKDRKACIEFRYGGCKANGNNFLTESACKERCLQPGRSKVPELCRPQKDPGPCRGSVLRWYYDDKTDDCRQFFYGGCLGNSNRFKTEAECKQKCHVFDPKKDHCSLPREPGNCNEKIPRWYFDNSENRCMPFYYTGCEGNANQFETREACETDCPPRVYKDLCHLPALIGECYNYTERWYYDAQAGRCGPFYYGGCGGNQNNFELLSECQKRCEGYIAEERIDLPTQRPATQEPDHFRTEYCFYGSDPGPCRPSEFTPQWFYDRADGVCKQFLYGGCDGNRNRFNSREECEHYCGNAQDICTLPKTVGPCSGNYPQWYYDRQTDTCYEFDYGGCQGNGNRFNTKYDCDIRCKQGPVEPPTVPTTAVVPTYPPPRPADPTDICYATADPGPCTEEQSSWYFDAHTGRCQAFVYGGCLGNANRFDSEEQCERQCGQFKGQDVCNLPYDVGPCSGNFRKWFYDVENKICREFTYSGCGGNSNRFSTLQECETLCFHHEEAVPVTNDTALPHQAICRLPVVVGSCSDGQYKRWYYDEPRRTCVPFIYSGCGGNFNRFKNFDTCIKFCVAPLRDVAPPPLIEDPNEIIVQEPDYCEEEQRKCGSFHCPYGVEKFVDSQDCERCRCNNPCREVYCTEGTRCAVDLYHDEYGRVSARGICRAENKPGQCPNLATGSGSCTAECQSDADCPGPQKCCSTDCNYIPVTSCVYPVEPVVPATTRPPPTQRPFYGAYPPSIVADEPYVTAPEGNYATLKCIVRGMPTPVVSWRKGTELIDGTGGRHRFLSDGSLQIIGLYRSDAGVYYCSADNGVGHPVQREFTLDVTDPTPTPAEVIGGENTYVVVTLGTPAILQCYAIGWPRPGVTWWRGDRMLPLSSGQYEQRRDFSLLVKSISLRNLGPYVCQAYNGLGKAASGTVTVQAIGPVYSNNPEDEVYFQYLVSVPQRPEGPSRPWLTYRPQISYTPPYETTHAQTRPPTHPPAPPTEYTTQETPRVFVVPIAVNISLDQTNFQVGSDISIPCNVDGYPVPRVTWYKDNEIVYPSRKIEITESNRLRIVRADGSDTGTYRCVAQNQYGEESSQVYITVEGIYVHPNCTDNIFFANCELIVKAKHCEHKYYARFCCKSCTLAGQLPSHGSHIDTAGSSN